MYDKFTKSLLVNDTFLNSLPVRCKQRKFMFLNGSHDRYGK